MAAASGAERGRALEALLETGFGARRAAKALALTGNRGVEPAMDWLVAHEDDPDSDSEPEPPQDLGAPPAGLGAPPPDLGAPPPDLGAPPPDLGAPPADLGALAAILGAPRPPEQDETHKLLSEAGQERERRRRGQELAKLREWRRDEERRRAAEERRRDRAEERAARQRVKEKIERDKAERAQRFAPALPNPAPVAPQEAPAPREYQESRIQLRLPDGRALTQSFRAREPLAAVRLFVQLHGGPGGQTGSTGSQTGSTGSQTGGTGSQTGGTGSTGSPPEPFSLRTAFPRRLFTEEDMEKPLQELGLVPSAVVIVAKKEGS